MMFLVGRSDRRRASYKRRYALLESLPDALFIVDKAWKFTHANNGAQTLLRRSAEDLVGRRIDQILDPLASELTTMSRNSWSKRLLAASAS